GEVGDGGVGPAGGAVLQAASGPTIAANSHRGARIFFTNMGLLLLEALAALACLVFIVWWTMFSGRRGGERRAPPPDDPPTLPPPA
ncbi:hypothetical protein, partial [Methylibium petroleiphilum]